MAVTAMTLISERWLDEVMLSGAIDNVAGASIAEAFTLPASLGDIAIMSIQIAVVNVATGPGAADTPRGVRAAILSSDASSLVDMVGVGEFLATTGVLAAFTIFDAFIDPDALCLMRNNERLEIRASEMDVNAAPTGDLRINMKAVRVRPIETIDRGPIRLVR